MASVWRPLLSLDLHEHLPNSECTLQFVEESIGQHVNALASTNLPSALWCLTALDVTREAVALRLLPAMIQPRLAQMTQKNAQACVDRWIALERGLLKRRLLSDAHVWHVNDLLAQSGVVTRAVTQPMTPDADWVRFFCSMAVRVCSSRPAFCFLGDRFLMRCVSKWMYPSRVVHSWWQNAKSCSTKDGLAWSLRSRWHTFCHAWW